MDRQASLDVSYFSRSFNSSDLKRTGTSQSRKSRVSSRLAQARSVYGLPSRGSTASLRLNSTFTNSRTPAAPPSQPPRPPPLRLLQHLRLAIATARSDCWELQRDMNTYEYLFLRSSTATSSLLSLCEFIPPMLAKAEATEALTRSTVQHIRIGVTNLSKLEGLPPQLPCITRRLDFQLKQPSAHSSLRLLFKGVREISGICCILQVHCNGWYTAFEIKALLLDGRVLKLKLPHVLAGVNSDLNAEKVQRNLVEKLFITVEQAALALCYHADYGKSWREFAVEVRGTGWVAAQLFPEGRLVLPGLEDIAMPGELETKQAVRYVQRHLFSHQGRLQWKAPASRFASKEADSLLLDEAYVTEKLGSHLTGHITQYTLGAHEFSVELHTRGGLEQITVARGEDVRTVDVDKLKALQFLQLRTAWTTLLRSLELQLCVRQLFAELFP